MVGIAGLRGAAGVPIRRRGRASARCRGQCITHNDRNAVGVHTYGDANASTDTYIDRNSDGDSNTHGYDGPDADTAAHSNGNADSSAHACAHRDANPGAGTRLATDIHPETTSNTYAASHTDARPASGQQGGRHRYYPSGNGGLRPVDP